MVASSSNLLLLASTHQHDAGHHHVWNDSTIPNDPDLLQIPTMNPRGFMIRSNSNNNIRGSSTGDLKDMIMLETVCTPTITTTSSTLVSRKHEREQRDDIDSVFNNIRSTSTRNIFSFPTATPLMPEMMMRMPALPTPAMNQSSKQKNERSNSNNENDNDNAAPTKKKKKKNHMGSSSNFAPTSAQEEEEDDDDDAAPIFDITTMMTTTLQPRVHSMCQEEEEEMMMMMMMLPMNKPVRPAPPCPLSTTDEVITTPTASFPSKLDKALSVFSLNDGDEDDGNAVADNTADDWGVFASYDDEEDEEDADSEPNYHKSKSTSFSRLSSFTKHTTTTNPCFQPRAPLPVFAATTAGAE